MTNKEDKVTPRLHKALALAFKLNGHDARKKSTVPYLAHLLAVCALVQHDGGSEDEAIASLLHDTLEDKPEEINREEIRQYFGEYVLKIIEVSTDTPKDYAGGQKPPWKERKEAYLEHIRQTDPSLLRITIADKIDNARAILADLQRLGDQVWEKFNAGKEDQLWYYRSCVDAYDLSGYSGPMLEELRSLVDKLTKQTSNATNTMGAIL
jgi:(p)ppGpp synthase/HD superfamily hydrolase